MLIHHVPLRLQSASLLRFASFRIGGHVSWFVVSRSRLATPTAREECAMQFELTPEQTLLRSRARELAREVIRPRAAETDRTEQYPWDNVAALRDAGFMGYTIPRAYGGAGGSFLDATLIIE